MSKPDCAHLILPVCQFSKIICSDCSDVAVPQKGEVISTQSSLCQEKDIKRTFNYILLFFILVFVQSYTILQKGLIKL